MSLKSANRKFLWLVGLLLVAACSSCSESSSENRGGALEPTAGFVDDERITKADEAEPGAWIAYGRTYEEQRFAPLAKINRETVADLGLAWTNEIGIRHRLQSTPLVVDGVMYYTDSWSFVYAVDAATGEEIWTFDPKTRREYARWSCCGGPMNRGVGVYKGRVYVATFDARLVAIDAATGRKVWDVDTADYPSDIPYTISGAPLVAAGKVYIGNSGSEYNHRGYLTAYDAETGEKEWRFFTVPGDPSKPFENPELEMAAKTWKGEWWKAGAGGTVWNSIVYDPDLHTVYMGVGNGTPWSRELRSPGGGDNLFLASIVAVDPDTGRMKWYYQTTPGDNWDYTATQDIVLADMNVDGEERKVLMQAPKNGFFYVIDRTNGELLRANPYGAMTWATHVDMKTGRPVENPAVKWEDEPQWVLPGNTGAHNWEAMSFDETKGVMYIPVHDTPYFFALPEDYTKSGIYKPRENSLNLGVARGTYKAELIAKAAPGPEAKGILKAFDPLTGKTLWATELGSRTVGGVLATDGGLVFQGDGTGYFSAYNSDTGEKLWTFNSHGLMQTPPMSYEIDGKQYVAVQASANFEYLNDGRIMVFALDGGLALEQPAKRGTSIPEQPPLTASTEDLVRADTLFTQKCGSCHGYQAKGYRNADLRMMSASTHNAFNEIVLGGLMKELGMDSFADELNEEETELIHQYIISRANIDREAGKN